MALGTLPTFNMIDYEQIYVLVRIDQGRTASRLIMQYVEEAMRIGDFQVIDELLRDFDVTKGDSRCLTGLIRSTCRAKEQLPNWQPAYERAWLEMVKQKRDPKSLFIGLQDLSYLTEK